MEVKASLRHLRIAPRKVRLVVGLLRGKSVEEAERQLLHLPKLSAQPILKLLYSAKANAKNNFDLDPEHMYIKTIFVNEGVALKRYMPKAMGKADIVRKRASHIELVLAERLPKDAGKGKTAPRNEKKDKKEHAETKKRSDKKVAEKSKSKKTSTHSSKK